MTIDERLKRIKEYIGKTYSYLCSHSHNSWAIAMQVFEAKTYKTQKDLARHVIELSLMILANTLSCFCDLDKIAKEEFLKDRHRYACTIAWQEFGTSMKSLEAEVIEFVQDYLNDDKKEINKETTFENLNLNGENKLDFMKTFAEKKFFDSQLFSVENLNAIGDLIEQFISIRENEHYNQ